MSTPTTPNTELRLRIIVALGGYYRESDGKYLREFGTGQNIKLEDFTPEVLEIEHLITQAERRAELKGRIDRWHAVKDELPSEGEYVLARLEWRSGKELYAVLQHETIEDNAPWIYDGDELSVTHWQRFNKLRTLQENTVYE